LQAQLGQVSQERNAEASWATTTNFSNQIIQQDLLDSSGVHGHANNNSPLKTLQQTTSNTKLCRKYSDSSDPFDIPAKILKLKDIDAISDQSGSSGNLSFNRSVSAPWGSNSSSNFRKITAQHSVHLSSQQLITQQLHGLNSQIKYPKLCPDTFSQIKVSQNTTSSDNNVLADLTEISPRASQHFANNSASGGKITNKSKRYNKTADALKRSGLMDVTMKTAELLQRNRSLQKQIHDLNKESLSFMTDVLQNPENEGIRDKIMQSQPLASEPYS